jgi:type VI secretion system secreted protein VgrG
MQTLPANIERYLFTLSGSNDELRVVSFGVTEGISQLFSIDLELVAENDELDFEKIVGQAGSLTLQQYEEEEPRYFHGIISRFEQGTSGLRFTTYNITLVPKIWYLMHRHNCRIFQKMSVHDIVQKILNELGVPGDEYRFVLQNDPPKREYCVQYRESEFDFISRLLEEEGIFYFFEHQDNKHILVMGNSLSAHLAIQGENKIIFHEPRPGQVANEAHIYSFNYTQEIISGKVSLKDYNFKKPALNLKGEQTATKNKDLEVYDYPGKFEDPEHGKHLAKVRLEEYQTVKKVANGATTCTQFATGFFFSMEKYPRDSFNKKYLITQHQVSGNQPQVLEQTAGEGGTTFSSSFECIPFEVPYRPDIVTPKPVVEGSQTAFVVGPKGEEIYTNEHGQIKVQFHWDREGRMDENSSCWIRVSQLWAGRSWGAMYIPRVGQEVIVDFLEGDPDRPIITGRVYHGTNKPPYPLPANKTRSTIKSNSSPGGGGYNEFRYEDKKGQEEIYLQAEKDWNILVKNDKTHLIQHDETLTVDNDRTRTVHHDEKVTIDNDRTKTVHRDETLTVDQDRTRIVHHDEKVTIDNDRNKEVKKNQQEKIGVDKTITVGNNHTENIGKNMSETIGHNHSVNVKRNMSLKVGRNKTDFTSMASAETVGLAKALTVGAAYQVSVGGMMNETVGGLKMVQVGFSKTEIVGQTHTTKAKKIIMEAEEEIVIKCGGGTITFDAGGNITIKGTIVKINS